MRVLITASGIQEYIFDITQKAASARLRGRSARLGLVLDLCYQILKEEGVKGLSVVRNAGSRLEVDIDDSPESVAALADKLQKKLDQYSLDKLDAQVWFNTAVGAGSAETYQELTRRKLSPGRAVLQNPGGTAAEATWNEKAFAFHRRTDERQLQREDRQVARNLPEAHLGRMLAYPESTYLQFTQEPHPEHPKIEILDRCVHICDQDPDPKVLRFTLGKTDGKDLLLIGKRLTRHAPVDPEDRNLMDLNQIAEKSQGAQFLGVLKADLDNAGEAFRQIENDSEKKQRLSEHLDEFFTAGVEELLRQKAFEYCYVVYSGGDDLFLLGPWDQLLRFAMEFQGRLRKAVPDWGAGGLTLSAGFNLAHPGSAVRHLADEVESALDVAKGRKAGGGKLAAKDRLAVFARVLKWDEAAEGMKWAAEFMGSLENREKPPISTGFLQRFQYYAGEIRQFYEENQLIGLRAVPLLHNEWQRNKDRVEEKLKMRLTNEVMPKLARVGPEGESLWRVIDFAARFACYALR